jgi:hypothetical protein
MARSRLNSRAGWFETIHAPLPSAAACWLNRAVADDVVVDPQSHRGLFTELIRYVNFTRKEGKPP